MPYSTQKDLFPTAEMLRLLPASEEDCAGAKLKALVLVPCKRTHAGVMLKDPAQNVKWLVLGTPYSFRN